MNKPCVDCGKTIPGGNRYCDECRRRHSREDWGQGLTGARGNRGNWKTIRLRVLRRDRHRCRYCGTPCSLEVHHRDGNARNDSLDNLETVCEECHQGLHDVEELVSSTAAPSL